MCICNMYMYTASGAVAAEEEPVAQTRVLKTGTYTIT